MKRDSERLSSCGSVGSLASAGPRGSTNPRAGGFSPRGRSSGAAFSPSARPRGSTLQEDAAQYARPRGLKPAARWSNRRRGNILLFVIFILGTLFAASMAFLALMRTDSKIVIARKDKFKIDVVVEGLSDEVMRHLVGSVMGQGIVDTAGNVVYVPYVQHVVDKDGPGGVADGIADQPDRLSAWAEIAGVNSLVSSVEPYDPGTGVLEWFAVGDLYRAWDERADVHAAGGAIQPSLPLSRPLRIRPLDGSAAPPPYFAPFDQSDDTFTHHDALSDADGDGVVDSRRYRIALLPGGEADWGPAGYMMGDTDDTNCSGVINAAYTGAPSYAGGPRTPLPCDDFDGDGTLSFGTAYPQSMRRDIAAQLRDPDTDDDRFDDLYLSLRVIQNGGLVNLNTSHRTLVDNLLGKFGPDLRDLTAGQMMKLPYGVTTERALRHRGLLAPLRPGDPLSVLGALGEDMLAAGGENSALYRTLFDVMINNNHDMATGELQWTPLLDEPGISGSNDFYDIDWAGRWTSTDRWNDLENSADLGNQINYAVAQLLTNVSIDDLFLRNGMYDPDGPGPLAQVLLTDLANPALPNSAPYDPASDGLGGLPTPYFKSGDSSLEMYPGYDPNFVGPGTGDPSFIDATTGQAKVPLRLEMNLNFGYGRPRDAAGQPGSDPRFGKMQFALHSIGDINNPTQREIQTVLDYFTVMLRNVAGMTDIAIHDQAAQLTANFIDFADFDGGAAPFAGVFPGGQWDYPTEVQSQSRAVFYGFENQPFISEVFTDGNNHAVELRNPFANDLSLADYKLRVVDTQPPRGEIVAPIAIQGVLRANGFVHFYDPNDPGSGGVQVPGLTVDDGQTVQLIRSVRSRLFGGLVDIVVDEFDYQEVAVGNSRQRDTQTGGGWRVVVPPNFALDPVGHQQTLGSPNAAVDLSASVAPVHAMTDSRGLESAYPTTGSLLLLMRYAHSGSITQGPTFDPNAHPMTAALKTGSNKVDNGHMPVFDQLNVAHRDWAGIPFAQPMDGTTLLNIPWGQLVFDYFTALSFDNRFDPMADPPLFTVATYPGDAGDPDWPANPNSDGDGDGVVARMDRGYDQYVAYLRANQPAVELGGARVHGRININAAPWKVLDGLPLMHPQVMPIYRQLYFGPAGDPIDTWKWSKVLPDPNGGFPMGFDSFTPTGDSAGTVGPMVEKLGGGKAKGIVAYRELREIQDTETAWTTGNYNTLSGGARLRQDTSGTFFGGPNFLPDVTQRHTAGFLTVGELANVQNPTASDGFSQMDNGQANVFVGAGAQNYLFAVAPLVALGDWVTVKGHTFTTYGVLTGHGEVDKVNSLAERFEMVVDRSNVLISDDPAERPEVIYKIREPLSELNPN